MDSAKTLGLPQSSESILYEYISSLKDSISEMSLTLTTSMHSSLKQFGGTLKTASKENKASVKEVAKTFKDSKKKADRVRALQKSPSYDLDEAEMMLLEREAADLSVYKFYVEYASKRYHKEIINVYKKCEGVLMTRPLLQVRPADAKERYTGPEERKVKKGERKLTKTKSCQRELVGCGKEERKGSPKVFRKNAVFCSPKMQMKLVQVEAEQADIHDSDDEQENADQRECENKEEEKDEDIIEMLEEDAKSHNPVGYRGTLKDDIKKSIKLNSKDEIVKNLSVILGKDDEALVQLQNYVTEN